MQQHTVDSLTELYRYCFDKQNSFFDDGAFFVYRGQANTRWGLVPTVFRNYRLPHDSRVSQHYIGVAPIYFGREAISLANISKICDIERVIYQRFFERLRAYPQIHIGKNDVWEMLCIAQHFGVPTRLLDWTSNLNVAAYLAMPEAQENGQEQDGAIWCLNATRIAEKYRLPMDNLYDEQAGISGIDELPAYSSFFDSSRVQINSEDQSKYGFRILRAPSIENRMINQSSFFTVDVTQSDYNDKGDSAYTHYDHVRNCESSLLKITIPADKKNSIKHDLEQIGINYNYIFPDLYGLGLYLQDYRETKIKTDL